MSSLYLCHCGKTLQKHKRKYETILSSSYFNNGIKKMIVMSSVVKKCTDVIGRVAQEVDGARARGVEQEQ